MTRMCQAATKNPDGYKGFVKKPKVENKTIFWTPPQPLPSHSSSISLSSSSVSSSYLSSCSTSWSSSSPPFTSDPYTLSSSSFPSNTLSSCPSHPSSTSCTSPLSSSFDPYSYSSHRSSASVSRPLQTVSSASSPASSEWKTDSGMVCVWDNNASPVHVLIYVCFSVCLIERRTSMI